MKKLIYSLLAIVLLCNCEKAEQVGQSLNDNILPEVLYAYMADGQDQETRTYQNNGTVMWQPNDAVSFFYGNQQNARYVYKGEYSDSKVQLVLESHGPSGTVHKYSRGIYPYDPNITVVTEGDIDKIHVTYPAEQTYAANSFGRGANLMIATGDNSAGEMLYFRNACGYLVIKLYGNTNVKNITLSPVNGVDKISGEAIIVTDQNNIPMVTMSDEASSVVTLDCSNGGAGVALSADAANPTEFWFALPPVNFEGGIRIVVTDINGVVCTKQTTKAVNITRNNIQPMAPLEFVSNTPALNQIWYTKTADAMAQEGGKNPITFGDGQPNPFDATISRHYYDEMANKFVIEFETPLKTIKKRAFFYKYEIETIELPDGLETIEELGLAWLRYIKEITIPGSVNMIGFEALDLCDGLTNITFLPSPTKTPLEIGRSYTPLINTEQGPFFRSPLTSIYLNRELVYVNPDGTPFKPDENDEGIFYNEKHDLAESVSVTIGSQVKTIPDFMFSCLSIKSLTIPGTLTAIGNNVFNGCSKLASITFEPSPTGEALTIGYNNTGNEDGPFCNSPLTTVILNRELKYTLAAKDLDADDEGIFSGRPLTNGITIGNQVRTLYDFMFSNSGITSLTIPGTITSIGNDVFNGCVNLTSITFEPSPTDEPLTLGYNTENEEDSPFLDSPLTTVYLNRNIIYTLASIDLDADDEGIFYGRPLTNGITIGNQVRTLYDFMFSNSGITSLTIPGTITSIGNDVFNGCENLASITFEPSPTATPLTLGYNTENEEDGPFLDSPLTTVNLNREIIYTLESIDLDYDDEGIFSGRPLTNGVTLGAQVRTLSPYMFSNSGIASLTIPGTVVEIKNNAFLGCTSLASVRFEGSTTPLTIGFQPGSDERGPFYQSPLTSIYVNRELVASDSYAAARNQNDEGIFSSSLSGDAVTTVILQGNVKTISDYMFAGVPMQTMWIPKEVTSIGRHAFYNCKKLYGVTLAHTAPPALGDDAFDGTLLQEAEAGPWIALEEGSDSNLAAFRTAVNWSEYASIIKAQITLP